MLDVIAHQLYLVSSFGNNAAVVIISVIIVFIFLFLNNKKASSYAVLLTLLSVIYALVLKGIFRVKRPDTAHEGSYFLTDAFSFPSAHVVFYTVFWGFIIYLTIKYGKKTNLLANIIKVLSSYFIAAVGLSRVYLGMHHLSDAFAGYLFGGIFLYFLIELDKKIEKKFSKNKKHYN